ncbi:hypothetical protein KJS94_07895 [Flavihumibacter rivuli]|uniref:hypothetical protein n=1 Tax=Flavihumibacter rivuli TaxID=2838156 RepID=UPI001BDEB33C|nr:hypothetical protein [Flavihumibacter rivuli]ULQ58121.1 hypothetical protein KJS94_07895 [Flavihumibacter rivuli]
MRSGISHIRHLRRTEIDTTLWNTCITNASNGLIYGYSHYLDEMCSNWDALVLNDYEAVMPLPWRKKWGIHYLYYPAFCASLGVFGNNLNARLVDQFLFAIPRKFRYWDFPLNHGNLFDSSSFPLQQRRNFCLDLHKPYETLYEAFRENNKRNIRKCLQLDPAQRYDIRVDEVIALAREFQPGDKTSVDDYARFAKLYQTLNQNGNAKTLGLFNSRNKLLASCVFFFSHKRAYYILVGNHPDGKTIGASHALINAFIKDYAGKELILDFEGSDIRNLAFFYSGFGASEEFYPAIRMNRLPGPLKWLKD